jgi:hypothetical protein
MEALQRTAALPFLLSGRRRHHRPPGERLVVVRALDAANNAGLAKVVVR